MPTRLPSEIKAFISRNIDSIEMLEVLTLLKKNSAKEWSAREIAEVLRSSETSIVARLHSLKSKGFIRTGESDSLFVYAPITQELAGFTQQLIEYYAMYRLRVIDQIYRPMDSMEAFADAFRIKQKGDTDG